MFHWEQTMDSSDIGGRIGKKGTFVRIRYRLKTDQGEYVKGDPREGYAHLEFFTGYNQVFPALERRLLGKEKGDQLRVELSPEEAFGPYRCDLVKESSYEEFPEGRALQAGRWVAARNEKTRASYGYYVKEKREDRIVLDFNHPLAGRNLHYDLEILEARAASLEEQKILRPCETGDVGS
jgi:FKBP-type peptidyl-prolyl cis-trans isomerase SlyD